MIFRRRTKRDEVKRHPAKCSFCGKAQGDRGIRLKDFQPEVVQLGNGVTEADLLVHDERNPALAYLIARLGPPRFPTPIGVFTAVERPRYEEALNAQVAAARAKAPADLSTLLDRGDTWTVS